MLHATVLRILQLVNIKQFVGLSVKKMENEENCNYYNQTIQSCKNYCDAWKLQNARYASV
jgi:hypothetical protein